MKKQLKPSGVFGSQVSRPLPISVETDILRLRQLANDYQKEYELAYRELNASKLEVERLREQEVYLNLALHEANNLLEVWQRREPEIMRNKKESSDINKKLVELGYGEDNDDFENGGVPKLVEHYEFELNALKAAGGELARRLGRECRSDKHDGNCTYDQLDDTGNVNSDFCSCKHESQKALTNWQTLTEKK